MGSRSLYGTPKFRQLANSKYSSQKVHADGHTFDSKLEYRRYIYLKSWQEYGSISDLQCQVSFELIPKQCISIARFGKKGQPLKPKVIVAEEATSYRADFVYTFHDKEGDVTIIEDTKGFKTAEYIIKRKLMRLQGNPIVEITSPAQIIEPAMK